MAKGSIYLSLSQFENMRTIENICDTMQLLKTSIKRIRGMKLESSSSSLPTWKQVEDESKHVAQV